MEIGARQRALSLLKKSREKGECSPELACGDPDNRLLLPVDALDDQDLKAVWDPL